MTKAKPTKSQSKPANHFSGKHLLVSAGTAILMIGTYFWLGYLSSVYVRSFGSALRESVLLGVLLNYGSFLLPLVLFFIIRTFLGVIYLHEGWKSILWANAETIGWIIIFLMLTSFMSGLLL
jgi:hypothetical protein